MQRCTSSDGCQFYYRFSTAKNIKKAKPTVAFVNLNGTSTTTVAGAPLPAGASKCVTPPGGAKVIKEITNKSKADLVIEFVVFNECTCNHFIVDGVQVSPGRKQKLTGRVRGKSPENPDKSTNGSIYIKKGTKVLIKVWCDEGSNTNDPCRGKIINYRLRTKSNKK